jgi:uncharacterized protein (TIGR00369 family)
MAPLVVSPHCTTGLPPAGRYPPRMVVDEPVRGTFAYLDHPGLLSLSGLEQMRRFQRKEIPYGPAYFLTGLDLVEVEKGGSTWRLPATPWLRSAAGIPTGGVLAFAADGALGTAIYSTLPPGTILATSELSLNFLRPPSVDAGDILTHATLIQAGRSLGLSEATVEDASGRLLAHATSRLRPDAARRPRRADARRTDPVADVRHAAPLRASVRGSGPPSRGLGADERPRHDAGLAAKGAPLAAAGHAGRQRAPGGRGGPVRLLDPGQPGGSARPEERSTGEPWRCWPTTRSGAPCTPPFRPEPPGPRWT